MRVLVVYGSTRGGTEGLAETVAAELRSADIESDILPANKAGTLAGYDAVIGPRTSSPAGLLMTQP
jgi:menaquinone-dependent protoporphyrinogen oxidase